MLWYVNVPNDLSKVKTKLAFNLTKRQLVCFGIAAAVGIPTYLLARSTIGNTGAMFLMMAVALPAFLLAMYEKDGLPLERVVATLSCCSPAAWDQALSDAEYLRPCGTGNWQNSIPLWFLRPSCFSKMERKQSVCAV